MIMWQVGGVTLAVAPCAIFGIRATSYQQLFWNSVSANPFLDLYFKWDERFASGSCEWRLVCCPDLPRSCSPERLWPSLGFPGRPRCPHCSPQQGRDRASVSHPLKCFSFVLDTVLKGFIHWFRKYFLGIYSFRCSAKCTTTLRQVRLLSSCSSPRHSLLPAAQAKGKYWVRV